MEILFCEHCGKTLQSGDLFCPHCGKDVAYGGQAIKIFLPLGVKKLIVAFTEKVENVALNDGEEEKISDENLASVEIPEECYLKALEYVVDLQIASISILQRKLCIGYPKAGKIIDWMQENHFIGPFSDSKDRRVYITREQLEKLKRRY